MLKFTQKVSTNQIAATEPDKKRGYHYNTKKIIRQLI